MVVALQVWYHRNPTVGTERRARNAVSIIRFASDGV